MSISWALHFHRDECSTRRKSWRTGPRLDGRVIKEIPINERPTVRSPPQQVHASRINEADSIFYDDAANSEKTVAVKAFINAGFKGTVQRWRQGQFFVSSDP